MLTSQYDMSCLGLRCTEVQGVGVFRAGTFESGARRSAVTTFSKVVKKSHLPNVLVACCPNERRYIPTYSFAFEELSKKILQLRVMENAELSVRPDVSSGIWKQ